MTEDDDWSPTAKETHRLLHRLHDELQRATHESIERDAATLAVVRSMRDAILRDLDRLEATTAAAQRETVGALRALSADVGTLARSVTAHRDRVEHVEQQLLHVVRSRDDGE